MKTLFILLALGQFQVEELKPFSPGVVFLQEELGPKPQEKKAKELPVFDLLTAEWCGACGGVKEALGVDSRGVATKRGLFTVRTWNVDSRGWLGANSIPAFAYQGRVFQYGYSTPENLMENFRRIILKSSTPVKANNYPSMKGYKPQWSWPGDLRTHLRNEHGVTESLTQDQAEALHDALHSGHSLQQIKSRLK